MRYQALDLLNASFLDGLNRPAELAGRYFWHLVNCDEEGAPVFLMAGIRSSSP